MTALTLSLSLLSLIARADPADVVGGATYVCGMRAFTVTLRFTADARGAEYDNSLGESGTLKITWANGRGTTEDPADPAMYVNEETKVFSLRGQTCVRQP